MSILLSFNLDSKNSASTHYENNSIALTAKWIKTAKWTVLLARFLVFVIRTSKIFDIKMKESKKEKPSDILIRILSLNRGPSS